MNVPKKVHKKSAAPMPTDNNTNLGFTPCF